MIKSKFVYDLIFDKKRQLRSRFTQAEDVMLKLLVNQYGDTDWQLISKKMRGRNQRQCKDRWYNYLAPELDFSPWRQKDDKKLEDLFNEHGAKWKLIAHSFPSRTSINVKNRWLVLQRQKNKKNKKASQKKNNKKVAEHIVKEKKIDENKKVDDDVEKEIKIDENKKEIHEDNHSKNDELNKNSKIKTDLWSFDNDFSFISDANQRYFDINQFYDDDNFFEIEF